MKQSESRGVVIGDQVSGVPHFSFFFVFLCFASLIRVIMVLSGFIYLGLKTMPKDIVSKFCFLLGKCGQQVDIKGTIRDSYLFEVD